MSKGVLARFYHSKAWELCRDATMQERNFICEKCGRPAIILHHKVFLTEENVNDPDIALNPDNLEALCHRCHDEIHNAPQSTVPGLAFDSNGNLVRA